MEKERKTKTLSMVALIVAILGLTVAFAAMSTTLTINGTASIQTASWEIKFANLSNPTLTGDASVATAPDLTQNSTYLGDYKVVLTKPGDSVTYTFDVVNNGTIDANLLTFTKNSPVCESTSETAEADKKIVCDNLTYTLTYTDTGAAVAQGDELTKGQTKNLTLTLSFDGDKLPSNDVEISNLQTTLFYEQK